LVSTLACLALPLLAWLPGGLVVLACLAGGPAMGAWSVSGAALPIALMFAPAMGLGAALLLAVMALLPPLAAGILLSRSRSLSFAFQGVTLAAAGLVLVFRILFGDPVSVFGPLLDSMKPAFEEMAASMAGLGVGRSAEELATAVARMAWATLAWLLLLTTLSSLFLGLWRFAALREQGLFGREFVALRLGGLIGWLAVGALLANVAAQLAGGDPWAPAEDLLFVLSGAFLLQGLAIAHALRSAQVTGPLLLAVAYLSVIVFPMLLVGLGLADTWVRFRERFINKTPSSTV
jgi:hypothetical protein